MDSVPNFRGLNIVLIHNVEGNKISIVPQSKRDSFQIQTYSDLDIAKFLHYAPFLLIKPNIPAQFLYEVILS